MLVLSRRENESFLIYPSPDISPDMTVAELFEDGPIHVRLGEISRTQAKIVIDASRALSVIRAELGVT